MHVIARWLAVTVDLGGPSGVQVVGEDRDHSGLAMGVLTWAVDVAEPADRVRDAGCGRPGPDVCLARPLGRPVRRERCGDAILRGRYGRLVPIQGTSGGGEDHGGLMPVSRLDDVQGSL